MTVTSQSFKAVDIIIDFLLMKNHSEKQFERTMNDDDETDYSALHVRRDLDPGLVDDDTDSDGDGGIGDGDDDDAVTAAARVKMKLTFASFGNAR